MDRLSEIEARWAKGKQGPWMWDVNKATHSAHLTTTHSGRIYIMGFRRWGTQGAQPIFQDYERRVTEPLSRWAVPRMAHHPDFDMDIDHPDAQKIAAAPTDIAWLISVARAAQKLDWAVKLYLKHSNSPICVGWDEMIDALTELDNALRERGRNDAG